MRPHDRLGTGADVPAVAVQAPEAIARGDFMPMTKSEVVALLKQNQNKRGIEHWNKKPRPLRSYGIGLTQFRKLAKQIGRDHRLAQKL